MQLTPLAIGATLVGAAGYGYVIKSAIDYGQRHDDPKRNDPRAWAGLAAMAPGIAAGLLGLSTLVRGVGLVPAELRIPFALVSAGMALGTFGGAIVGADAP